MCSTLNESLIKHFSTCTIEHIVTETTVVKSLFYTQAISSQQVRQRTAGAERGWGCGASTRQRTTNHRKIFGGSLCPTARHPASHSPPSVPPAAPGRMVCSTLHEHLSSTKHFTYGISKYKLHVFVLHYKFKFSS